MEALVNFHCERMGIDGVDYSYLAQSPDNLFCDHWVKALDEYGLPVPLGRKIQFVIRDQLSLEAAISSVQTFARSQAGINRLTTFERSIIDAALS
jgi:hypothetical protein